jgi:1-aminocyclopropane-1-carboxylate deaminase/D-cysteine desulfhydrase-like pyridoxal-dependent ACC family enzyme
MQNQLRAARDVAGLYKMPGERGYNPDATVPWNEASAKTRCSILVMGGSMANERAKTMAVAEKQTTNITVVVPSQIAGKGAWEAFAAAPPERQAIDAKVVKEVSQHVEQVVEEPGGQADSD